MRKIISLILCLILCLSILCLTSCKGKEVYYFDDSGVGAQDVVNDSGVIIDKTNFPEGVKISVTKVKTKDRRFKIAKAVLTEATELFVYDISSIRNGVTINPYKPANVIFPVPSIYSADKYEMSLYFIAANASTELIEYKLVDNGLYVSLSEMGLFAIILVEKPEDTSSDTSSNNISSVQSTTTSRPQPIVVAPGESVPETTVPDTDNNTTSSEVTDSTSSDSTVTPDTPDSGNSSDNTTTSRPNDGFTSDYIIERD